VRTPVTDPDEIRQVNAALIEGLTLLERAMFKRKKQERMTADAFKFRLNELIDEAGRAHIGQPAILSILQNVIDNAKYVSLMGARSSYHTSTTISAPPSPSTVEKIAALIRGK
jgi:hypothetical protein